MKPAYSPDNTRSSFLIILLLAAGVTMVALLFGLSDKPDVRAIGVAVTSEEAAGADTAALQAATVDETGAPIDEPSASEATTGSAPDAAAGSDDTAGAGEAADAGQAEPDASRPVATAIAVTPIPIEEPAPQIAPAVDTTVVADDAASDDLDELDAALAAPVNAGTIAGQFFTRPDEDDGATVDRNELTITLNEDGTGAFAGVLDMTLVDGTHVVIGMSGPIRWSNQTPQVFSELAGTFTLDSPIDADDLASDSAELTISSLGSGSGSLCPDTCYGFTFPPQTGF